MPQMMRQAERDARARGREDRRRSRQPNRRSVEHPRYELVLALPQLGALVLKQLPPGSPCQHQKRNNAGNQERKPTALDQLRHVRGNEDQLDDKEEPIHCCHQKRVVTPFQGNKSRQHRRYRH